MQIATRVNMMTSTMDRLAARAGALAVCLLLAAASFANAQETQIGLRSGLNLSTFRGDTDLEQELDAGGLERRSDFHLGLFATFGVNEQFALQPEILYTRKGSSLEGEIETVRAGTARVSADFDFDYLQVPVLAKFRIPTGSAVTPVLYAGPSLAYSLNANADGEVTVDGQTEPIDDGIEEESVSDFTFGGVIGGGIQYALDTGGRLSLDFRYGTDLTDINSEDEGEDDVSLYNESITVSLGFSIPL
jgi:hypothetical protein